MHIFFTDENIFDVEEHEEQSDKVYAKTSEDTKKLFPG